MFRAPAPLGIFGVEDSNTIAETRRDTERHRQYKEHKGRGMRTAGSQIIWERDRSITNRMWRDRTTEDRDLGSPVPAHRCPTHILEKRVSRGRRGVSRRLGRGWPEQAHSEQPGARHGSEARKAAGCGSQAA